MACNVTSEELSAWKAGDLPASRASRIATHLTACPSCRSRLATLKEAGLLLSSLRMPVPSADALLAARRRLDEVTRAGISSEIMTLEEAAQFLRLTPAQMDELAEELPAFELAGQIRIRRQKLLEWVKQRERGYTREIAARWTTQTADWLAQKGVAS